MTKIVLKGTGQNMKQLDLVGTFDYLDVSLTATTVRFFDDASNYVEFTGSGFTFDANNTPTGGTVTGAVVVDTDVAVQTYTAMSVGLLDLYNLMLADDVKGLYSIILDGNDKIIGSPFDDVLVGGRGDDTIRGRNGNDRIFGEAHNDRLLGDDGNDILNGSIGNDRLDGGADNDKMIGGSGVDRFYFTTDLKANRDKIVDFTPGVDKLYLDDAIFTEAGPAKQTLDANSFVVSTSGIPALDADDRIIYDSSTGKLYYDSDGSGAAAAKQFALLLNTAAITADDIMIV